MVLREEEFAVWVSVLARAGAAETNSTTTLVLVRKETLKASWLPSSRQTE